MTRLPLVTTLPHSRLTPAARLLLHFLEIAWPPGAIEGRGFGAVDAEIAEPAFARDRLDPAAFLPSRRGGAEIEVDGLGLLADLFRRQLDERAKGGLVLVGLDLRARRGVIDRHRPEELVR